MKSFLEKSKKSLVLLLTAAMIFTSVPLDTFAAAAAPADDEAIVEEVVEEVAESSDSVEALAAEDTVSEEVVDPVEPDNDPLDKTILIEESNSIGTNRNIDGTDYTGFNNLTYGNYINVKFLPYVATTAYTDGVTFSLLKVKDPAVEDSLKYLDTNLADATADFEGLGLTVENTKTGITIKGRPTKALATTEYVLRAVDDDNTNNRSVAKFEVKVNDANCTIDASGCDYTYSLSTITFDDDGTATGSNSPIKMNYTVDGTKAISATNVKPAKILLKSTEVEEVALSDFTFEVKGAAGTPDDAFTVSADKTSLYAGNNITLTIQPKTGLFANATNTTYTANISIKNKAFTTKVIAATMTVTNDLTFYYQIGAGDEILADNDGSTDLTGRAAIKAGKAVDGINIIAKGGNGLVSIEKTSDSGWITGLKGNNTPATGTSAFVITGTPEAKDALGNYNLKVKATDSKGNTKTETFVVALSSADVVYSFGDDKMATGTVDGSNKFSWSAPSGYTSKNAKTTLTITNNSKLDLKLAASLEAGSATELSLGSNKDDIQVAKDGGTATLEITPDAGLGIGASKTATIVLKGKGVADTKITVTFDVTDKDKVTIKKPENAADKTYATLNGQIGKSIRQYFEAQTGLTSGITYTLVPASEIASLSSGDAKTAYTGDLNSLPVIDDDDELEAYGLALGRTTGLLSGTVKGSAGNYAFYVKATSGGQYDYKAVKFTVAAPDKALALSQGSLKLEPTTTVALGDMKQDATEGPSKDIKVKNNTEADFSDILLTVTNVTKKNPVTGNYDTHTITGVGAVSSWTVASRIFDVVYTENKTLNTQYNTSGIAIKGNDSKDITLKVKKPVYTAGATRNDLAPGEYKATVSVASDTPGAIADDPYTFVVSFKVVATPTITATAVNDGGNAWYTIDKTYVVENATSPKVLGGSYTATLEGDTSAKFSFAWAKKSGETLDIADSGLTLDNSGRISGKAAKAGSYKVIVTATKLGDSTTVGTFEDTIVVKGTSSVSLTLGGSALAGKTAFILPGVAVNDPVKNAAQLQIAVSGADAKGLKVTVTDADDDRDSTDTWDEADMAKNPGNPYIGSTDYIGVSSTTIADTDATVGAVPSVWITSKGNSKKAVNKATVTVSGDNLDEPKSINVYLFTTPKLTIKAPDAEKMKFAVDDATAKLTMETEGAMTGQTITWKEVDVVAPATTYMPNGMTLGGTTGVISGTPSKLGDFQVTLQAEAAADSAAYTETVDSVTHKFVREASAAIANDGTQLGYAAQKSDKYQMTLTVEPSDAVKINYVNNASIGVTGDNNATGFMGTVVNGKVEDTPTGYTMATRPVGYTASASKVTITMKNASTANNYVVTAAFASTTSNFEVAYGATDNKYTFVKNTTHDFVITPKEGLAAGTYEDTLTISGDKIKPVTFKVKFVVEAESFKFNASATNNTSVDNDLNGTNGADKKTKAWAATTAVVTDSAKSGDITLATLAEGAAADASKNHVVVLNTGNSSLKSFRVTESTSTGANVAAGDDTLVFADVTGTVAAGDLEFAAGEFARFSIVPKDATTLEPGSYTSYVKFVYYEGSATTPKTVVVPVKYVVYNKEGGKVTLDVTDPVTLPSKAEGYTASSAKKDIKVTNSATGSDENALYGLRVSIDKPQYFDLITTETEFSASTKYESYTLKNPVGTTKSVTFTVQPKAGLEAGNYETTLSVHADNMKKDVITAIKFKVTATQIFKTDVYSTNAAFNAGNYAKLNGITPNLISTSYAKRLYDTIIGALGKNKGTGTAALGSTGISQYITQIGAMTGSAPANAVTFDLDKDGKNDMIMTFCTDKAGATTGAISTSAVVLSAKVTWTDIDPLSPVVYDDLTAGSYKLELSVAETTAVTNADITDYFTDMTFDVYSEVSFQPVGLAPHTGAQIKELAKDLKNDNVALAVTGEGTATEKITDMTVLVKNGTTVASVLNGSKLPTAKDAGFGFSSWVEGTANVTASTIVSKDSTYAPKWHEHKYADPDDKDPAHVKWEWTGNENDGYSEVKLFLYCVEDCADEDKGVQEFSVAKGNAPTITVNPKAAADCIHGPRTEYKASKTVDGKTYEDTKATKEDTTKIKGHTYTTTIEWKKQDDGSYKPVIKQVCSACTASTEGHEYTVPDASIAFAKDETKKPTCVDKGKATFTITSFVDGNKKTITGDDLKKIDDYTKDVELDPLGHKVEFEFSDVDLETLKGKAVVRCTVCNEILYSGDIKLVDKGDGNYTCEVTGKDGVKYTGEYTDHVHKWVATWAEWARTNAADKFSWSTSLTLTCNVGKKPETRKPEVTITKTTDDKYIDYVATATFNGQTYTDEITVDAETGEITAKHEHKWGAPSWSWSTRDNATATFTCSVGKETKTVNATVAATGKANKNGSQYKATVTGPDGNPYERVAWFDASGNPVSGEGIGIEGLATEYEYTGKQIKPEVTVIDYALDKVLVKGTDYTVSYGKNKDAGEKAGSVTVKGKGNYGEKGGEITVNFDIVDPTKDEKPEDYFTVKSIKVSKEAHNYNGEEQYPATVTIKTDAGDVTATWESGSYTFSNTDKSLNISVSNNINKGSGIVAVRGNNGKGAFVTKTATFSIKACDISTLSSEDFTITAPDAVWTVKGAKSAVEVTYGSETLVEGRDYTLSWKYTNKKNIGENAGQVIVAGKNNFTKKAAAVNFNITAFDIEKINNVAVYEGLAPKGIKVTLYDGTGVVIPAKQYAVTVEKDGTAITTSKDKLKAGDEITVKVEAASGSNLTGDESLDIKVAPNLAKIKVVVPKTFTKTFTGEAIELDSEDFESGKISVGTLEYGTDFEIVGYQNNIKKGTMTVFIQGISEKASGIGKIKVKIVPQKVKKAE